MRTFLIILLGIAVIIGLIALYLFLTIPNQPTLLHFPLNATHRALLARVPASANAFALIPTAPLLHRKLLVNPVTRDAVEHWTSEQPIPSPWLLGGSDVVVWRVGKRTSYAIRIDTFRAFLVRTWMMWSTDVEARWDGQMFVINSASQPSIAAGDMDDLLKLTNNLPEAEVLVVQRDRIRGAFPPIGRPCATSVRLMPNEILLTSRARTDEIVQATAIRPRYPRGALIAAAFARPPQILSESQRLTGTNVSKLVANGGEIALYDIDPGTFLPQPKGVVIIPANPQARESLGDVRTIAALTGEVRDTGNEILVSFDRKSMPLYLKDAFVPATWPASSWAVRIDAARISPILERLGDNRGLRLVAPRLYRSARDLRRWIGALQQAESIEASDSISGGFEELRVRVASK